MRAVLQRVTGATVHGMLTIDLMQVLVWLKLASDSGRQAGLEDRARHRCSYRNWSRCVDRARWKVRVKVLYDSLG
jgi:hypothetical protein